MGVYIKGVTKSQLMKVIINSTEFMPDDFEVIEVKVPHGRLIDTDALARKIVESNYGVDFINKTTALIMNTPTVIESEGESR